MRCSVSVNIAGGLFKKMKLTAVRDILQKLFEINKKIDYYTILINSTSKPENEVHTGLHKNPNEILIVKKVDKEIEREKLLTKLPNIRYRLQHEIREAELDEYVKAVLELYYVECLSIRDITERIHYEKTRVGELKKQGEKKWTNSGQ